MKELMTRSGGTGQSAPAGAAVALDTGALTPPTPGSLADNRAAGIRLTILLIALSLLISITGATIWMSISFVGEALRPRQVAVVALLHSWPVIPALALMWRWTRRRLFGVL